MDRKKSHRRILEDLNNIRNKAEEVWNKIGEQSLHENKITGFAESSSNGTNHNTCQKDNKPIKIVLD